MSPAVIAAIGSALAVVVSAVFAGIMQLQHNRQMHAQSGAPYPAAPPSPPRSPGSP